MWAWLIAFGLTATSGPVKGASFIDRWVLNWLNQNPWFELEQWRWHVSLEGLRFQNVSVRLKISPFQDTRIRIEKINLRISWPKLFWNVTAGFIPSIEAEDVFISWQDHSPHQNRPWGYWAQWNTWLPIWNEIWSVFKSTFVFHKTRLKVERLKIWDESEGNWWVFIPQAEGQIVSGALARLQKAQVFMVLDKTQSPHLITWSLGQTELQPQKVILKDFQLEIPFQHLKLHISHTRVHWDKKLLVCEPVELLWHSQLLKIVFTASLQQQQLQLKNGSIVMKGLHGSWGQINAVLNTQGLVWKDPLSFQIRQFQLSSLLENWDVKDFFLDVHAIGNLRCHMEKLKPECEIQSELSFLTFKNSHTWLIKIPKTQVQFKTVFQWPWIEVPEFQWKNGALKGELKALIQWPLNHWDIQILNAQAALGELSPIVQMPWKGYLNNISGWLKLRDTGIWGSFQAQAKDLVIDDWQLGQGLWLVNLDSDGMMIQSAAVKLPHGSLTQVSLNLKWEPWLMKIGWSTTQLHLKDLIFVLHPILEPLDPWIKQGNGPCSGELTIRSEKKDWESEIRCHFKNIWWEWDFWDELKLELAIKKAHAVGLGSSYVQKGPWRMPIEAHGDLTQNGAINWVIPGVPLQEMSRFKLWHVPFQAKIQGSISFKNLLTQTPQIVWNLKFSDAFFRNQPVDEIHAQGSINPERILSSFQLASEASPSFLLSVDKKTRDAFIEAELNHPFWSTLLLTGISPRVSKPESQINLMIKGYWKFGDLKTFSGQLINRKFYWQFDQNRWEISPFKIEIQEGKIVPSQVQILTNTGKGSPKLLAIHIQGSWGDPQFKLQGVLELAAVASYLTDQILPNGQIYFQWEAQGGIDSPLKAFGSLRVKTDSFYGPDLLGNIRYFDCEILFQGVKFQVPNCQVALPEGTLAIQGQGSWDQQGINWTLKGKSESALISITDSFVVRGNLDIESLGTHKAIYIQAKTHIFEGFFLDELNWMQIKRYQNSKTNTSVEIQNRNWQVALNVQGTWENIQIRNQMISGNTQGQFTIVGLSQAPTVLVNLQIVPGMRITYQNRVFVIQNGQISKNGPELKDTYVFVQAQSRVQNFDIFLTIQGRPPQLDIQLTSNPSLDTSDILSLITFGQLRGVDGRPPVGFGQVRDSNEQLIQLGNFFLQNLGFIQKVQQLAGFQVQLQNEWVGLNSEGEIRKIVIQKPLSEKARLKAATGEYGLREFELQYQLTDSLFFRTRAKQQDFIPNATSLERQNRVDAVLGIDLEYQRGFK